MLTTMPASQRGHAHHGWLDTYHSFSFADYYDPSRMGFRALRVINEDRIAGGGAFGTHPHRDMEIITYVLEGSLEHRDSLGSGGVLVPGEVQHMSAGRGIRHSEANASADKQLHLLQIWLVPTKNGIDPNYQQKAYPISQQLNKLHLVASEDGRDGSLQMVSDGDLYAAKYESRKLADYSMNRKHGWLQVAQGNVAVNGSELQQGDGLAISDEASLKLEAGPRGAEFLLFDLA